MKANYEPLVSDAGTSQQAPPRKVFSRLWRAVNLIMATFFLLAAYVQINDPDPYVWVPLYIVPSLVSLALVFKPNITENVIWRVSCVIHISVCILGSLYCVALVVEAMQGSLYNPLIHEEGRELAGLTIIIIWLSICRFTVIGSNDSTKGSVNNLLLMTCILGILPLVFWLLCFVDGLNTRLGHCKDMFPGLLGSGT